MTYQEFLAEKVAIAKSTGLPIEDSKIHPILKPHQRDIVKFCVLGGRRAIFAAFGLGKTLIQLETLRIIKAKTGCEVLIVCPLGVRQEFKRDAQLIGLDTHFIRTNSEMQAHILQLEADFIEPKPIVWITNYESIREGKIDVTKFGAVSLDEAAILRGFGGTKTFRELMRHFEGTATYRFVATATPSPNEFIELLAYAAYLGIMEVSEAKTRFFKRDSTQADKLTLHPHKELDAALHLGLMNQGALHLWHCMAGSLINQQTESLSKAPKLIQFGNETDQLHAAGLVSAHAQVPSAGRAG